MTNANAIADALRMLQAGDAAAALKAAARIAAEDPAAPRAHLVAGVALRILGELAASRSALERANGLDPDDYAIAFELGTTCAAQGEDAAALAHFDRATRLRPGFAPAHFAAALQRFRQRDWPGAVAGFETALALDAANVPAMANRALALAEGGRIDEALAAARRALEAQPGHPDARHALGWILHKARRAAEALPHFEAAVAGRPDAAPWLVDHAKALQDLHRLAEAEDALMRAIRLDPAQHSALRKTGQHCVAHGDFARAARLFDAAAVHDPDDIELPMFIAQVRLLLGDWREGWKAYSRREHRRRFEQERAAAGQPYRVPAAEALSGKQVIVVGEQGLGDTLFFTRFAPRLKAAGAHLLFAGDPRLHGLLARTALFGAMFADVASAPGGAVAILAGDLPIATEGAGEPCPPPLHVEPLPERRAARKRELESAGPRPWIGVTWRAGTPRDVLAQGLYKTVPLAPLMSALAAHPGTVFALQRGIAAGELETASASLGRPVRDLSKMNDDLEDALAVVTLLDRHVAVSNTNVHLAAAAGRTADVLVPFPPEWRWWTAGESPWFRGFRVHRQTVDGDWSRALAALAR